MPGKVAGHLQGEQENLRQKAEWGRGGLGSAVCTRLSLQTQNAGGHLGRVWQILEHRQNPGKVADRAYMMANNDCQLGRV